jgi:hypothetical protein
MKIKNGTMNLLFMPECETDILMLGRLQEIFPHHQVIMKRPPSDTRVEAIMIPYVAIANKLLDTPNYVQFE